MNNYIEKSDFGNHVLYSMCQSNPLHTDPEVVKGKLSLIGRAYSATVERKAGRNFDWKPLLDAIVSSELDQHIQRCKQVQRIDSNNLPEMLKTHKLLTDIFKKYTALQKRSLASKYLHFHAPQAFFIFDSIAVKNVQKNIKHLRIKTRAEPEHDEAYEIFCRRCLSYRDELEKKYSQTMVSPRYLDSTLLGYSVG